MTELASAYGAIALLLGALVFLCLRRDGWRIWGAPLTLAAAYVGLLLSMTRTLGQPIPTWAMLEAPQDPVKVIWCCTFAEGQYILILIDDQPRPPRYVALPWSDKQAQALIEAEEEAKKTGGGVKIKRLSGRPFEPSLEERDPLAYAEPQPAPPPKDQQP